MKNENLNLGFMPLKTGVSSARGVPAYVQTGKHIASEALITARWIEGLYYLL